MKSRTGERIPHPGVHELPPDVLPDTSSGRVQGKGQSAHEFLQIALCALDDRAALRDAAGERSMARTVAMFNALTDRRLSEDEGWLFMCCLKLARDRQGGFNADDMVDLAGYAALLGECRSSTRECRPCESSSGTSEYKPDDLPSDHSRRGTRKHFDPGLMDNQADEVNWHA